MPLIVTSPPKNNNEFKLVPAGTYVGRCVTVVNLGRHLKTWKGEQKWKEEVYIAFEVPAQRVTWTKDDVEHEGPSLIGHTFTKSIFKKSNLGKLLIPWRGKPFSKSEEAAFDLFALLDKPAQLVIIHDTNEKTGKTYANIASAMQVPPNVEIPARETPLLMYDPGDSEAEHMLQKMPDWMRAICIEGHKSHTAEKSNGVGRIPIEEIARPVENVEDNYDNLPF